MFYWWRGPRWVWCRDWWGMPPYGVYPYDEEYMLEMERRWLREYEMYLERELKLVRKRLAEIEGRLSEPPGPPEPPRSPGV